MQRFHPYEGERFCGLLFQRRVWAGTLQTISTPPPQTLKIWWNKKEIRYCYWIKSYSKRNNMDFFNTWHWQHNKVQEKAKKKGAKHFSLETPQMVTRVWVARTALIPNLILNPVPLPCREELLIPCGHSKGNPAGFGSLLPWGGWLLLLTLPEGPFQEFLIRNRTLQQELHCNSISFHCCQSAN